MSLKKNISIKLLLPTIAVIFTAAAFLGWKISNYVEDNIRKEAEIGVNTALERISETLGATNEVLTNQVSAALKILKEKGLRSGVPELGKPVELKTGTVPDLLLGGQSQYNNFKLVDEMKSLMGASATLFVKNGDDFVRLSTNIIKSDGSRVIGTKLDPSGKAIAKVKQGESFIGAVDILGFPYLTGYEPMYNSSHQTIGVWFVGYPASTLNMIGKTIGRIRIAQNGFTVLLDNKGKLLFRSDNVSEKLAENILNETEKNKDTDKSKGWIIKKTKFEAWGYTIAAAYPESDIQSEVNQARVHILLLSILAALILTGVIYGLVRALIIKPVKLLSDASARVASGDFNVSVALKVQDELGILASSFNKMVLSIKNSITEIHQKKEEAEKAVKEANRVKEEIHLHREYLQDSTARILSEMEKFSAGDLTAHLKAEKDDDIGKLISGFNTAVARMRKMVGEVQSAILTAANAGNEISSSTRQMAAGAADQAGKIAGIAAAAEQITGKIAESTKNAETSSAKAKTAGIKAHEGGKVVRETIEGMNKIAGVVLSSASTIGELGQSSSRIGEIIEVINDIADQTNLLALNAAIEAARAGEQGMGFAVVADEVRKLAERTTRATKQISIMIDDIRKNTSGAVDAIQKGKEEVDKGKFLADRAGCVLEEIIEQTDELSSIIEQVAHANEEQSEASREISRNIEAISAATQQSAAGVRQVARSTEDLNSLTETLQELVSVFKLKD